MSKAKILIVDDSATVRTQLRKYLEEADFTVIEAPDGAAGLSTFNSTPEIKLVISDINMPFMDGLTMAAKIRATDPGKTVPIFILTTESGDEMKSIAKDNNVTAWVTKPCNRIALLRSIDKFIQ